MKIVQSFWTGNKKDLDKSYGWASSKYHYLGWILSVNQLRDFYEEVELFTDKFGYEILIEKLQLPYTKVHTILDGLNNYNENLWALAKIKTYSLMEESFLHIDGDVFIWKKFDKVLLQQGLIVQNIETTTVYYRDMWNNIYPNLKYLPYPMEFYHNGLSNKAYNMGIFGGNDIEFIKKYATEAFHFVDANKVSLDKIDLFNFNIFFEQVLLYEMTRLENKKVSFLINEDIGDNEYNGFANFDEVPQDRTYLHLLGFFKRQKIACLKLEIYVQKYYPDYYEKLENLLSITPKLSSFGYKYSKIENTKYEILYIQKLLKREDYENKLKQIFSRNITLAGKASIFQKFLENKTEFILIPTSNFKKEQNFLKIYQIQNENLIISLLNIDDVIFSELDGTRDNKEFEKRAIQYLQDDFPISEQKNYIATLWKRIFYLISVGVFLPISKELYNKSYMVVDEADA